MRLELDFDPINKIICRNLLLGPLNRNRMSRCERECADKNGATSRRIGIREFEIRTADISDHKMSFMHFKRKTKKMIKC